MNGQKRILELFIALLNGQVLTKKELTGLYKKEGSTIQRDMAIIEEVLEEEKQKDNQAKFGLLNREKKGTYALPDYFAKTFLTDDEIFAVLKVLLSSRAFTGVEMDLLVKKFINQTKDKKRLETFINNEALYYHGVPSADLDMFDRLHEISDAILDYALIEFEYTKKGITKTFQRIPHAIFFSDLYFFMATSSHTAEDGNDYANLNKFRINNMKNLRIVSTKHRREYKNRFEPGIFRDQTAHYPFLGKKINLIVDFYHDPAYILDRFPHAKIAKTNEDGSHRIEIISNDGYGVKMWLLGQGDMVKVISPQHIIDYLVSDMTRTLKFYGYEVKNSET